MTSTAPSWIFINSTSGALTIIAPEVATDTEFDFYISSSISGVSNPIQKLVKLTILNCLPSNWKQWLNTSSSTCETCKSEYNLISGIWVVQSQKVASESAKALSTTTKILLGITTIIIVLTSILNISSLANLWMTINQLQLLFIKFKLYRIIK